MGVSGGESGAGGVQLVLFGDPYQLAPVPGDPEERAYFADRYTSMWFFDARVWQEADLTIYELDTIHRQHELEFKQLLTAVRHGEVGDDAGVCNLEQQRRFFRKHVQTWLDSLCDAVQASPRAQVYGALAGLTRSFIAVETQGFDMLEA